MNRSQRGLLIGVVAVALKADQPPNLSVFIYDYADLQPNVIKQAEAEAVRIFRLAGIEMEELRCPTFPAQQSDYPGCDIPVGPATLYVNLLPRSMARRYPRVQDSFGFALLPEDGSFAITANVFAENTVKLAAGRGTMSEGVLLGHLIAHELGHLLLGACSHSRTGIMTASWHVPELKAIEKGEMLFMSWESERMRASVRARKNSDNGGRSAAKFRAEEGHAQIESGGCLETGGDSAWARAVSLSSLRRCPSNR